MSALNNVHYDFGHHKKIVFSNSALFKGIGSYFGCSQGLHQAAMAWQTFVYCQSSANKTVENRNSAKQCTNEQKNKI